MKPARKQWNLRRAMVALFGSGLAFTAGFAGCLLLSLSQWSMLLLRLVTVCGGVLFGWLGVELFSRKRYVVLDERTEELLAKSAFQCFFYLLATLLAAALLQECLTALPPLFSQWVLKLTPAAALLLYFAIFLWHDCRGE